MPDIVSIFYKGYGYKKLDEQLFSSIKSIEDVLSANYHFSRRQSDPQKLPKTYKLFNSFIPDYLTKKKINWYALSRLRDWIKPNNKKRVFALWAQLPQWNNGYWLAANTTDPELLKISINKAIDYYKSSGYRGIKSLVALLFNRTTEENINECAELLAKSTPSIMVCMLNKKLPDKYIVLAMKGLGKLTTQQNIQQKIDFNLLFKLTPKSRLKAMRQLFGIVEHNRFKNSPTQPFNPEPTMDDVRKLLFSCMIQENEMVTELIKRYEVILESCHKEVIS